VTNLEALVYHVGIKRRFLPIYKKYKVIGHVNEPIGDKVRLVLRGADGSLTCIPDVGKRQVKVYPDFVSAVEAQKRLKDNQGVIQDGITSGE
jgi:hypothetical protein